MNLPQNVTSRYASGLLRRGWNNTFILCVVSREVATDDDISVGFFFKAIVRHNTGDTLSASGETPLMAVERALRKHGVTFK